MIRLGQFILALGILALLLPGPRFFSLAGLVLAGAGCAPIYPSIIHSTPASAYVGNLTMPPLFGWLAEHLSPALFPLYLLVLLACMVWMHQRLVRKTASSR